MIEPAGRLFVVTGGPGSGKTTVIDALALRGYRTVAEAGRSIIREQLAGGGLALPWSNAAAFAELMLAREIRSYREAAASAGVVFFDRGLPDIIGFLRLMSLPVPPLLHSAERELRYDRRVFVAPPWPEIFTQDGERRQTFAEAVATYDAMVEAYSSRGYQLLPLPCASVDERVDYILDSVRESGGGATHRRDRRMPGGHFTSGVIAGDRRHRRRWD